MPCQKDPVLATMGRAGSCKTSNNTIKVCGKTSMCASGAEAVIAGEAKHTCDFICAKRCSRSLSRSSSFMFSMACSWLSTCQHTDAASELLLCLPGMCTEEVGKLPKASGAHGSGFSLTWSSICLAALSRWSCRACCTSPSMPGSCWCSPHGSWCSCPGVWALSACDRVTASAKAAVLPCTPLAAVTGAGEACPAGDAFETPVVSRTARAVSAAPGHSLQRWQEALCRSLGFAREGLLQQAGSSFSTLCFSVPAVWCGQLSVQASGSLGEQAVQPGSLASPRPAIAAAISSTLTCCSCWDVPSCPVRVPSSYCAEAYRRRRNSTADSYSSLTLLHTIS